MQISWLGDPENESEFEGHSVRNWKAITEPLLGYVAIDVLRIGVLEYSDPVRNNRA